MGDALRVLAPALIIFFIVAMATVVGSAALEAIRDWRGRKTLAARLQDLDIDPAAGEGRALQLLRPTEQLSGLVRMLVARVPRLADLALILEQANVKWSVQSFLVLSLGLGIGVGLATLIITRWLPAAILATAAATMVPFLHVRSKRARRLRAFEEHLPEAIDLMARALRAGHPFSAGMSMVADEIPDPVGIEFRRLFEQQRFGLSTTDALLALADRVPLTDVRILVTAVVVQREVGGNLAELLDNISYTIRERFKIRRQIRVHTAQGRLTGYILAAMPVITGFAFFVINPDYIMVLFKTAAGHFVLGTVLVLQVIGFIWIRRVINIEF